MFLLKNMKDKPTEDWDYDIFIDIFKVLDYAEEYEWFKSNLYIIIFI